MIPSFPSLSSCSPPPSSSPPYNRRPSLPSTDVPPSPPRPSLRPRRLPSYESNCWADATRRLATFRLACMYVCVGVGVRARAHVCAWKQVLTYMRTLYTCVCNCGFERRLFITIGGTSDSLIASNDFSMLG